MVIRARMRTAKAADVGHGIGHVLAYSTADSRMFVFGDEAIESVVVFAVAALAPGSPNPMSYKKPPTIRHSPMRAPIDARRANKRRAMKARRESLRTRVVLFKACVLAAVAGWSSG